MKKKKLVSLLLSALMVFSGSSMGAFAEEFADSETADENYVSVDAEISEPVDEAEGSIEADEELSYDLNGDGVTDEKDAGIIQNYLLGNGELSEAMMEQCDMNSDGKVNVFDLIQLRQFIAEHKEGEPKVTTTAVSTTVATTTTTVATTVTTTEATAKPTTTSTNSTTVITTAATTAAPATQAPLTTTKAAGDTYTTKNVTSFLNIRSQANVNASVLGTIPANAKFTVTSNNGSWAYAEYNGVKGWVNAAYIQKVTVTPVTTKETYTTKNVTSFLNIRNQANVNASVLGTIPANAKFTVTSNNGSWAYAEYNGIKGWVNAAYIQKVTVTPTPAADTYTTKNVTSFLNIRNQANVNATVLGTIPANAKFTVTSNNGSWAYAEYNGVKGWVNAAYIQKVASGTVTTAVVTKAPVATTTVAAKTYTTKNVTSFLNIRSQANVNASVLGTIPVNAKFNVTSNNGTWAYAEYNGIKGWVNAAYIQIVNTPAPATTAVTTKAPSPAVTTAAAGDTYTTKNVTSFLNIRSQANVNASVLGTIPANAKFTVTSNNGSWAYAVYNNVKGWVNAAYIQKVTTTPVVNDNTYTTKNVNSFLNIRGQANVNATVLGTIPAGAKFTVTTNTGSWAYAEYNGVKGWVNAEYIQKVTVTTKSVLLNVMEYNQHPTYPTGCESAALYMLLKYHTVDVTMEQIVTALPKGPVPYYYNNKLVGANPENAFVGDPRNAWSYGVFDGPMATTANQFKSGVNHRKGATVDDIIKLLDAGKPVIAWYCVNPSVGITYTNSWYDYQTGELIRWPGGEHAVVVCGYNGDVLTYRDPNTGGTRTMAKSQFATVFNELGGRILWY